VSQSWKVAAWLHVLLTRCQDATNYHGRGWSKLGMDLSEALLHIFKSHPSHTEGLFIQVAAPCSWMYPNGTPHHCRRCRHPKSLQVPAVAKGGSTISLTTATNMSSARDACPLLSLWETTLSLPHSLAITNIVGIPRSCRLRNLNAAGGSIPILLRRLHPRRRLPSQDSLIIRLWIKSESSNRSPTSNFLTTQP
jgi:hypothetical protein